VAPASFNTINKCAAGINDNLALGLINEALGSPSVPIALVPWVNGSLNEHPAYRAGLDRLHSAGAHIVMPRSNDLEAFDSACIEVASWIDTNRSNSSPSSS
jgi:phosphopantothenoylcysteine synthetase/decarboxylase